MLEIQNSLQRKSFKKRNSKEKAMEKNRYNIAAKYLSYKFIKSYNLKDPDNKILKHLIKIFSHFFKYKVQNIQLKRSFCNEREEVLEFKVNLFNNTSKNNDFDKSNTISVNSFFNNNLKFIII